MADPDVAKIVSKHGRWKVQFRRKPVFHLIPFDVQQMIILGQLGNAEIRNRQERGVNADDRPAKKLSRVQAIRKARRGRKQIRDLYFTGEMWRNITVRTATRTNVKSSATTVRNRQKISENEKIDPFFRYSPSNQQVIIRRAGVMFAARADKMFSYTGGGGAGQ